MKLNIGANIKHLRKERDITQEEFAQLLGVSCQSVSRWENRLCYPDMEFLPTIAEFFNVTVDKLLGVNEVMEQQRVNHYLDRFQEAISLGKVYDCIEIAREGVAEYPNSYPLLNKLMYALFTSGDSDGNIPEWHENMLKNDAEIIALGERIMKYCPDQDIRLEATARLAFQHCEMGRKEIGRSIYETLPSVDNCRENCIWWAIEDDEAESFLREKIATDCNNLRSSIWLLATSNCRPEAEQITIIEKVFELENLIWDNKTAPDGWGHTRLNFELACCYANLGDEENAFKYLRLCADAAKAFDERPDEQSYTSLLMGTVADKRVEFETSDNRPLCEIVKEKWLNDNEFDGMRNLAEFKKIIASL